MRCRVAPEIVRDVCTLYLPYMRGSWVDRPALSNGPTRRCRKHVYIKPAVGAPSYFLVSHLSTRGFLIPLARPAAPLQVRISTH